MLANCPNARRFYPLDLFTYLLVLFAFSSLLPVIYSQQVPPGRSWGNGLLFLCQSLKWNNFEFSPPTWEHTILPTWINSYLGQFSHLPQSWHQSQGPVDLLNPPHLYLPPPLPHPLCRHLQAGNLAHLVVHLVPPLFVLHGPLLPQLAVLCLHLCLYLHLHLRLHPHLSSKHLQLLLDLENNHELVTHLKFYPLVVQGDPA